VDRRRTEGVSRYSPRRAAEAVAGFALRTAGLLVAVALAGGCARPQAPVWTPPASAGARPPWPVRGGEPRSEVNGRYVVVDGPAGWEEAGALAAVCDGAMARFAEETGLPPPASPAGLHVANVRSGGGYKFAYTLSRGGTYLAWDTDRPRPAVDAAGWLETVAVHELAHSFQMRRVAGYPSHPAWWTEGIAEWLAERALGPEDPTLARLPALAGRIHFLRRELQRGHNLSLRQLLQVRAQSAWRLDDESLTFYAEAYALLRFLDAPEDPARRRRFRDFVRAVERDPDGRAAAGLNARFERTFGDLGALERAWLAWIRSAPLTPWWRRRGELRVLSDGALVLDAPGGHAAWALHTAAPVATGARLEARLNARPGRRGSAGFVLGDCDGKPCHLVLFDEAGGVGLFEEAEGRIRRLSESKAAANALDGPHRIAVEVGWNRVTPVVDGVPSPPLRVAVPLGEAWGVAGVDGHYEIREVSRVMEGG
jgi:hypothetical protein